MSQEGRCAISDVEQADRRVQGNKKDLTYRELNKDAILTAEKISVRSEDFCPAKFADGIKTFLASERVCGPEKVCIKIMPFFEAIDELCVH